MSPPLPTVTASGDALRLQRADYRACVSVAEMALACQPGWMFNLRISTPGTQQQMIPTINLLLQGDPHLEAIFADLHDTNIDLDRLTMPT
jgi:hypothetical protein